MNRTIKLSLLLILFTTMIFACSPTVPSEGTPQSSSIELTDGVGRMIQLDAPIEKVVSLAPSNTEILFAIGAGSKIVGRDSLSDFPAEAADILDIGGGFGELNIEAILATDPDLVLLADITPPEQIQSLEEVGLTVFALANPLTFDDLFSNLETVSKFTGNEEQAQKLITELKNRVQYVEEKAENAETRPVVFYELDSTDPNAPWTTGPGTFIDMLITMAGGENFGANLDGAWVQVSIEELLLRDPDVIILGDYTWGGVTPEDVAVRPGWEGLSAVKNQRVYIFDDNLVSRPGPRLIDGLEALAQLLHPDLFE